MSQSRGRSDLSGQGPPATKTWSKNFGAPFLVDNQEAESMTVPIVPVPKNFQGKKFRLRRGFQIKVFSHFSVATRKERRPTWNSLFI